MKTVNNDASLEAENLIHISKLRTAYCNAMFFCYINLTACFSL